MPEGVQPAYERDDARAESAVDLSELLLPGGKLPRPDEARSFAVAYSNEAFDGWLRQPAPVCAAASTAGAWNAAAGQGRTGKTSASVDAIMRLLIEISQDHLRDREGTLQRLLLLPVGAVKEAVDARLSSSGRSLAGKKRQGTTPKLCNTMLKVLCAERVLKQEDSPLKDGDGMPTDVFASLADVWAMTEDSAREILQKEEDRLEQERAADSGSGKTPNRSPRSAPPQGTPSSSTPVEPQDDDDDDEIAQEEDEEEEAGGEEELPPASKQCAACKWVHKKLQTEYSKLFYSVSVHGERVGKAFDNWCEGIRFIAREDLADENGTMVAQNYGKKKQLKSTGGREIESGIEVDRELKAYCLAFKRKNQEPAQKGFYKLGALGKATDFKIVEELCVTECDLPDPKEVAKAEAERKKKEEEEERRLASPSEEQLEKMRTRELRKFLERAGMDPSEVGTDKQDLLAAAKEVAARRRANAEEEEKEEKEVKFEFSWRPAKQCAICEFLHRKLQRDYAATTYLKEKRPKRVAKSIDNWCSGLRSVYQASDPESEVPLGFSFDQRQLRRAHPGAEVATSAETDAMARSFCREYKKRNAEKAREGFHKVEKAHEYKITEALCTAECKPVEKKKKKEAKKFAAEDVPSDDELKGWKAGKLRSFLSDAGVDLDQVAPEKPALLREAKAAAARLRKGHDEL
eukprot:Hpha_TRINITY_DN16349_c4_g1::TRINITY_DN16349_c4_g1_i2::g.61411::m.61411